MPDQKMSLVKKLKQFVQKANNVVFENISLILVKNFIGEQFKGGVKRAASGIGSLVTDVIPRYRGSLLGFENYAREQMAEAAQKRAAAELESPTAYRKLSDVRGIGDVPGFLAETLGEGAVDIASLPVPGGASSVVGRRLAQRGAAEAGEQIAGRIARQVSREDRSDQTTLKVYRKLLHVRAAESLRAKGCGILDLRQVCEAVPMVLASGANSSKVWKKRQASLNPPLPLHSVYRLLP